MPHLTGLRDFPLFFFIDLSARLEWGTVGDQHGAVNRDKSIESRGETVGENLAGYAERERLLHQNGFCLLGETLRDFLGDETYRYLLSESHMVRGAPQKEIPAMAVTLQVDLVVMGTVARSGILNLLIGNTSEAIVAQLNCSVLALKPEGFVTPVTLHD